MIPCAWLNRIGPEVGSTTIRHRQKGSTADRDLNIYPKYSFLYDQALAIKAFLAAGRVQTARDVADAVLATGAGSGSYFNERAAGHALMGDGTARHRCRKRRLLVTMPGLAWR